MGPQLNPVCDDELKQGGGGEVRPAKRAVGAGRCWLIFLMWSCAGLTCASLWVHTNAALFFGHKSRLVLGNGRIHFHSKVVNWGTNERAVVNWEESFGALVLCIKPTSSFPVPRIPS